MLKLQLLCLAALFALAKASDGTNCDHIACTREYVPVCASDGKTYANKCTFGVAKCRDRSLVLLHNGKCQSPQPQQEEDCATMCTMDYAPVCGSDGHTYGNECTFHVAQCKTKDASLVIVHQGECDSQAPSETTTDTSACLYEFACTRDYRPVCGSDGHTYSNQCMLQLYKCETNDQTLMVIGQGPCDPKPQSLRH